MTTASMTADTTADATVMERLRDETRPQHDATEQIPFSEAMMQRTLPRERYVGQLAAYERVHRALEDALAGATHPTVQAVWRDDLRKQHLLENDLTHFESERESVSADALTAADAYVQELNRLAAEDEVALLGHLYVLEGSTLGGTILRQHIVAAYDLKNNDGVAYYTPYGNAVMPHWREFKQRMNAAITDPDEKQRVIDAAKDAFTRVGDILRALSHDLTATH